MYSIDQTPNFSLWLKQLRDQRAKARILVRLERLRTGHWGDYKALGRGLYELRVDLGKGYRVYFAQLKSSGRTRLLILLAGGNKSTQSADIKGARSLLAQIMAGIQ